jgi:hypothetical protein
MKSANYHNLNHNHNHNHNHNQLMKSTIDRKESERLDARVKRSRQFEDSLSGIESFRFNVDSMRLDGGLVEQLL